MIEMLFALRKTYREEMGRMPDRIVCHPAMLERLNLWWANSEHRYAMPIEPSGNSMQIIGMKVVVKDDAMPGLILVGCEEIEQCYPKHTTRRLDWLTVEHSFDGGEPYWAQSLRIDKQQ